MFNDVQETIAWITSRRNDKSSFEHFQAVCEKMGNPQDVFYMVHVAGTNGKGSTVNYLSDLLLSQGFKVGTLTSPHLISHLDRIKVNQENIKEEAFLKILNHYYDFFIENELSMFEMDYLIMCEYFKEEKVDIAVVEVGLGGRLDATNVVHHTALSIITSIGFDHMEKLGNTLPEICFEKCGIIKENSSVLCGFLDEECMRVVEKVCKQRHAVLIKADPFFDLGNRKFLFHDKQYELSSYASYQLANASLALKALEKISIDKGFVIEEDKAREALKKSLWRGRFEIVRTNPMVIVDYAHTPDGLENILRAARELTPKDSNLICMFGCGGNRSRDRRFEMGEVSGRLSDFTVITSDNPRFEEPQAILDDIETGIQRTDGKYIKIIDRKEAIAYAMNNAKKGDVVILAGKGHEDYQEIKGVKHPMDERVLIREILSETC